jgi:hypothetical protein
LSLVVAEVVTLVVAQVPVVLEKEDVVLLLLTQILL